MKLMVKSVKELMQVLDETRETIFKDRKCTYPYTEWEHKRLQVKERLRSLPEYIHQAVETINVEEQKMGRSAGDCALLKRFPAQPLRCKNQPKIVLSQGHRTA